RIQRVAFELSLDEHSRLTCFHEHTGRESIWMQCFDPEVREQLVHVEDLIAPEVQRITVVRKAKRARCDQDDAVWRQNSFEVAYCGPPVPNVLDDFSRDQDVERLRPKLLH